MRGRIYFELGSYVQADEDYHMAMSLGFNTPMVYLGTGDAHRLKGEPKDAERSYSSAIQLDPDNWRAYYFRGVCYFQLRRFQWALEDFQRVIVLQPHNAGAYFARGTIRWLEGQCGDALIDLQAFVALSDDGEARARAQGYIEQLEAMIQCEPPPDFPSLV
jgi:tetratricopeptide (TPR) repeat protein